jgi:hypothetical protein
MHKTRPIKVDFAGQVSKWGVSIRQAKGTPLLLPDTEEST